MKHPLPDISPSNLLNSRQMRSVIALLALNEQAPQRARLRLDRLVRIGALSAPQQEAVRILFTLGAATVDGVLRAACADDEARHALRTLRAHEGRGLWLGEAPGPADA